MKKLILLLSLVTVTTTTVVSAQDLKEKNVPATVKAAFMKKYPDAKKVSWEMEKGNYEANWGGKSGEDNSAVFTPSANFVEIVVAMKINELPASIAPYIAKNYKGMKMLEAGKVTDAAGKHMFEVEIKGKDLIFDEKGVFIKED
ncbi:PepSY-like domain-containing protein [Parasediminibacterium paludis]|uniref:PepSY-like domain-containing protein n=1 Tax=Parasediminibacterium paludis TaxID=908966 RepID=A0ABV8PWB4_9BACT